MTERVTMKISFLDLNYNLQSIFERMSRIEMKSLNIKCMGNYIAHKKWFVKTKILPMTQTLEFIISIQHAYFVDIIIHQVACIVVIQFILFPFTQRLIRYKNQNKLDNWLRLKRKRTHQSLSRLKRSKIIQKVFNN